MPPDIPLPSTFHHTLWAKWGTSGERRYPLAAHLLDSEAAARALITAWLPPRTTERIATLLVTDEDGVADIVAAAAALHDLGKATPTFQGQLLSRNADQFTDHFDRLAAAGLVPPAGLPTGAIDGAARTELTRHEVASAVLLSGSYPQAGSDGLAAVVAGHHGRWHIPDGYDDPYPCLYYTQQLHDPGWTAARRQILDLLAHIAGVDPDMKVADPAAVPLLTGLVCLADWIASDLASRADPPPADVDWQRFHEERSSYFSGRIPELLGTPAPPTDPFERVFGFPPDRPVQAALVRDLPPGLSVVMAPTGDGKTEAALGHWLTSRRDREGLYFALPTMATADAMFDRVRALFAHTDDSTAGALLHSRSILNSFYRPAPEVTVEQHDHDHPGGGLVPSDWFTGRHRALLAPVAVGTVDQLLAGVLRHRFNFLRLLAAAGKTLVLDEVHSYDPYMARLVERLLAWAGELDINVILLSATLPDERLRAYVSAYTAGVGDVDRVDYPSVVHAARTGTGFQVTTHSLGTSARDRTVQLDYVRSDDPDTALADTVLQLRRDHPDAKLGVIVSTVKRCQTLGRTLADLGPDVLHSRFPAGIRSDQIHTAIARYGKHAPPGPGLVVATQVVEQSVDLDFDVLVTDLAPAPSLLQRIGRLWRHDRDRPSGLTSPRCVIVAPDPVPVDDNWAFLPYSAAEVVATWTDALDAGARTEIVVPGDVQAMVDAAHVTLDDLGGKLEDAHVTASMQLQLNASQRAVPTPAQLRQRSAEKLHAFAAGDGHDEHATRWMTQPSATVLLIGDAPGAWSGPLPEKPSRHQLASLLACTVVLSGSVAARAQAVASRADQPTVTFTSRLLHDVVAVDLDATDDVRLDPTLGLIA